MKWLHCYRKQYGNIEVKLNSGPFTEKDGTENPLREVTVTEPDEGPEYCCLSSAKIEV